MLWPIRHFQHGATVEGYCWVSLRTHANDVSPLSDIMLNDPFYKWLPHWVTALLCVCMSDHVILLSHIANVDVMGRKVWFPRGSSTQQHLIQLLIADVLQWCGSHGAMKATFNLWQWLRNPNCLTGALGKLVVWSRLKWHTLNSVVRSPGLTLSSRCRFSVSLNNSSCFVWFFFCILNSSWCDFCTALVMSWVCSESAGSSMKRHLL